jgi:outer membrane protein/protease secretion system outer membrane protein
VARVAPERLIQALQGLAPLEQWVRTAEELSPELRSVQAQLNAARMEVAKARSAHLPTLDLVVSSQRSRSENAISPQSQYTANSATFQLTVPLYAGGAANSLTRQASAEVERLTELHEAVKLDLGTRIHKEYRGVTEGMARVKALEQALESASVALDSAQKSLAAGVRTRVDVLNAQAQRMQIMRDLFQARYNTLVSSVRLEVLAGRVDGGVFERVSAVLDAAL